VSFFFTPIYMFILVFAVSFGPKKGTVTTYFDIWDAKLRPIRMMAWAVPSTWTASSHWTLLRPFFHRFQFTLLTSRTTIYLLFFFWNFFFFFGESLFLITLNYSSLNDLIPASFFLTFKSHVIFLLQNSTNFLNDIIFFYILFFSTLGFLFLLNLKYTTTDRYFTLNLTLDLTLLFVVLKLFTPTNPLLLLAALVMFRKHY
jgi:hypothetical protein